MNEFEDPGGTGDSDDARDTLITSRDEFHTALRSAFAEAARTGSRELWLMDADFADWPLGDSGVVGQLDLWVSSQRRLTLIAHDFDAVAARHARWVRWRRTWSHVVSCRSNAEVEADDLPTLLLAAGTVSVRLSDKLHYRGRHAHDRAEALRCKEMIDAILQRSEEAFPVSATGL
jgi:hypothetical protein